MRMSLTLPRSCVLLYTGRVYESTMLAASCEAKPDFTACGWAKQDGFPADSAMGMSRRIGGQSMHPVSW
jgi:hypothetical protein